MKSLDSVVNGKISSNRKRFKNAIFFILKNTRMTKALKGTIKKISHGFLIVQWSFLKTLKFWILNEQCARFCTSGGQFYQPFGGPSHRIWHKRWFLVLPTEFWPTLLALWTHVTPNFYTVCYMASTKSSMNLLGQKMLKHVGEIGPWTGWISLPHSDSEIVCLPTHKPEY